MMHISAGDAFFIFLVGAVTLAVMKLASRSAGTPSGGKGPTGRPGADQGGG
jgi:hypothetical protein